MFVRRRSRNIGGYDEKADSLGGKTKRRVRIQASAIQQEDDHAESRFTRNGFEHFRCI